MGGDLVSRAGGAATKPLIAVTGSEKPYIYDLPHMLSLPAGFEFRFRYRHAWIDQALRRQLAASPDALRERALIVIFHSATKQRLIPVRRCRVVNIESVGAIVYLRFRVEEFVRTPRDASSAGPVPGAHAWDDMHKLSEALFGPDIAGKELSKPLGDGFYLREASGDDPTASWSSAKGAAASEEWAVLAQALGEESSLWDVPMFYLLGFQQEDGKYAAVDRLLLHGAGVAGAWCKRPRARANKLVEGERYRLRVLEWCKPRDDKQPLAVNVTCKFDERMLQLESAASLVVGKYDVLEFSMLARQPGVGYLELRADPDGKAAASPDWPRLFAARVPVGVRLSLARLAVVVVCGGAGLAIHRWSKPLEVATRVPESLWQLIGTILIFVVLGEVADRVQKLGKDLREYTHPPSDPGAKP
jgi:hypothetical protein